MLLINNNNIDINIMDRKLNKSIMLSKIKTNSRKADNGLKAIINNKTNK